MSFFELFKSKKPEKNNPLYEKMEREELVNVASNLNIENKALKNNLEEKIKENKQLKNSILNSNDNSSGLDKFFNEIKTTFLSPEDDDDFDKKYSNQFKNFLFEQFFFYGGIEEDEINFLNQINVNKDQDYQSNKDIFLFKQKILERNYNELIRNLLISNELNSFIDKNQINVKKNNLNSNFNLYDSEISNNQTIKNNDNNIFNQNHKINDDINNQSHNNIINTNINESSNQNNENTFVTKKKQIFPKKDKKTDNLNLDSLLKDEDESLSFSNMNKKKNKWDEDDD